LGNQTRPDANYSSRVGTLVDLVIRSHPVSVSGEVRHPTATAKAHIQQFYGGTRLSNGRYSPVQNIREYNNHHRSTIITLLRGFYTIILYAHYNITV